MDRNIGGKSLRSTNNMHTVSKKQLSVLNESVVMAGIVKEYTTQSVEYFTKKITQPTHQSTKTVLETKSIKFNSLNRLFFV